MQLKSVSISQFRSIKELRIDFTQSCLALVGINESGKSNILRALRLLDPAQKVEPEDLRDPEHDEDHVHLASRQQRGMPDGLGAVAAGAAHDDHGSAVL